MKHTQFWHKAAAFAARYHQHQFRSDGTTPYIVHPFRVAMVILSIFKVDDELALTIALLHDVLEDTQAEYEDLAQVFGREIADHVSAISKDVRLPEEQRTKDYYQRIAKAAWQVRLVKLADAFDNVNDASDSITRLKAANKARHAIDSAGDDPRLSTAVIKLQHTLHELGL